MTPSLTTSLRFIAPIFFSQTRSFVPNVDVSCIRTMIKYRSMCIFRELPSMSSTTIVREFSFSTRHYESSTSGTMINNNPPGNSLGDDDRSTDNSSIRTNKDYFLALEKCKKTMGELEAEGPIDYECDEPITPDWDDLPDWDCDLPTSIDDETQKKNPTIRKHAFSAGEIAILNVSNLGGKKRPVVVLSSSAHNRLHGARLLFVPLTSKFPNSSLHQYPIFPIDTIHRVALKTQSTLLLDCSSMVDQSDLEPTHDALRDDALIDATNWWRWCINAILTPFNY